VDKGKEKFSIIGDKCHVTEKRNPGASQECFRRARPKRLLKEDKGEEAGGKTLSLYAEKGWEEGGAE